MREKGNSYTLQLPAQRPAVEWDSLRTHLDEDERHVERHSDIAFTPEASIPPSHIVVPGNGTATFDTRQPFAWSEGPLARGYRLTVGTAFGASDLHDTGEIHVTRRFVPALPIDVPLFGRLQTKINGQWYTTDFRFTVGANTVSAAVQIDSALWATDFVRMMAPSDNQPFGL